MKQFLNFLISLGLLATLTACEDPDAQKDTLAYFVLSQPLCDQPEMTPLPLNLRAGNYRAFVAFIELFSFKMSPDTSGTMQVQGDVHPLLQVSRCRSPQGKVFLNLNCEVDGAPRSLALVETQGEFSTHELLQLDKNHLQSAGVPLETFSPRYPEKRLVEIDPHNESGVFILDLIVTNAGSPKIRISNQ